MAIIRNRARCRKCNSIIESKTRHDFVWCKCKSIFVDGGKDYIRTGGDPKDFESLVEYSVPDSVEQKNSQEIIADAIELLKSKNRIEPDGQMRLFD